jgi:hypothetical protein
MTFKSLFAGIGTAFLASWCAATDVHAEQFDIQIGDTIEENYPEAGAGRLDDGDEVDVYRFSAAAGQLVFLEEISGDENFEGWLLWELRAPSGEKVVGGYVDSTSHGRVKLEEAGTYQLRVFLENRQPSYLGAYSLAIHAIPADQTFPIAIGDTVSAGQPGDGAGVIEVAGAEDVYTFSGTAGQLVFFEEVSGDSSFGGWLQWELTAPGGERVFSSYFDNDHVGREVLPETGTYTLRIGSWHPEASQFGEYSFRLRPIPADQEFTIQVGDTVSEGKPGVGAGRVEVPGARDIYRFQASAGQALYFEDISSSAEFGGWLAWEVQTPSGKRLFFDYFDNEDAGREDLTESGTYQVLVHAATEEVERVGSYSFTIRGIGGDTRYPIAPGQIVTNGVPGAGAGVIESAGGEDQYRFDGVAGQELIFEELSAAEAFDGWLRWEIKKPDGAILFGGYFDAERVDNHLLPATGTYTVRVYAGDQNTARVGGYSFRLFSPVQAGEDHLEAVPGKALLVPTAKFLCNDSGTPGDSLIVELPLNQSVQGGTVVMAAEGVAYTAKTGFTGIDSFTYRLRGAFGGEDIATVVVRVFDGAEKAAMVVSVNRVSSTSARVCLLGLANQAYRVEESTDLQTWTFRENITAGAAGEMLYDYDGGTGPRRFFRFVRP